MRQLAIISLFMVLVMASAAKVQAGVAQASTGASSFADRYDLSGLTYEEQQWFTTFVEGTFFADGWDQITKDILQHYSPDQRKQQRLLLDALGNKIGREWCKDNNVRKIDSDMLQRWGRWLKTTAREKPQQLTEVIQDIDFEVNMILQ